MKLKTKQTKTGRIKSTRSAGSDGAALMFDAVISTSRKDRDGDILEPKGAKVDPNCPLLWQHDHSLPIGKLAKHKITDNGVHGRFEIADTELGKDAAKLVEMGALRISHGFMPKEFDAIKDKSGSVTGYHVKSYEIMEVSLVSVPSNVDAVITAHDSFKSSAVRAWVKSLSDNPKGDTKMAKTNDQTDDATATLDDSTDDLAPPKRKGASAALGNAPRIEMGKESDKYSSKKYTARHAKSGQPVMVRGREVENASERDLAQIGAYARWTALKGGANIRRMDDHEKGLLEELVTDGLWNIGEGNTSRTVKGSVIDVKALLNDGTSGGQEVTPFEFDAAVITYPLLHSELLPYIDMRTASRDTIEGAAIGNPTVTYASTEGTAFSVFNTASLIAEINTSLFPVVCAIETGLDFLSDSAVDVGRIITENLGQRMLSEMDRWIAVGNGTSEPQGIFLASGTTSVASTHGTGGPLAVSDAEHLVFGIGKQYRNPSMRCAFLGDDTTYRRFRGVPVGASDARRIFGMDHQSYQLLEYPFRVQNDISVNKVAFGALAKYRLYRRLGMSLRFTQEGQTLGLKNTGLWIMRARYGGRVVDPHAFAVMGDAPSVD